MPIKLLPAGTGHARLTEAVTSEYGQLIELVRQAVRDKLRLAANGDYYVDVRGIWPERVPTPDRVSDAHHLAQVVGLDNLRKLAEVYSGEDHFQLPKAERALLAVRNARIASDYSTHKTARQLAAEYRLTERQVTRILSDLGAAAPMDRRQGALF